ncbi:NAD-dependent epimerase/dehydratase family protein [Rhodoferax sp.]|uniref:NAD-dependent epimerase/dehydratase family protein n=1 Tax=Rhodoferax sp. TaxID=50421 RepID=UPI002ACEC867|nr:NAD-dependent epimerase/dehydratase family protein [Rhodoferax sp.]MDZ7921990.1 NAD-dependent epimerase/dehydratase family protein [Rhodoferax sp.]
MSWTVLGANGTIGRRLVARLRATGQTVDTPGRGEAGLYRRPLGHVIYAIGLTADFRRRPYDTMQAHVSVLAEMLQQADFESCSFRHHGARLWRALPGPRGWSRCLVLAQDPSDLYNLSKLMGESLCLQDARAGVRVARLSNVVGGEDAGSANFVPSLVREARSGRIVLQTAADSAKDYIHIDDVAELLPRIAAGGRERLYNVASGVQTTHAQWTAQLAAQTGCAVEVTPGAPAVRFIPVDIGRIRAEFDFQPRPVLAALAGAFS